MPESFGTSEDVVAAKSFVLMCCAICSACVVFALLITNVIMYMDTYDLRLEIAAIPTDAEVLHACTEAITLVEGMITFLSLVLLWLLVFFTVTLAKKIERVRCVLEMLFGATAVSMWVYVIYYTVFLTDDLPKTECAPNYPALWETCLADVVLSHLWLISYLCCGVVVLVRRYQYF